MNEIVNNYKEILEFIPTTNDMDIHSIKNTSIYKTVLEFIVKNNMKNILISLSGGVDSMVLLEIVNYIKNYEENMSNLNGISLYCCHLNYNNREESVMERNFLKEYCQEKGIIIDCKDIMFKRGDIKRNIYEKETRSIRYNYYQNMCDKFNSDGVMLAHHKDDICENIFNNLMRGGREITDLTVIKEKNNILGVDVHRPMLSYYKDVILDFADTFQVPYFLDTTPDWSCRGKMRRNIFPECEDCYSINYKKSLLKLGEESDTISNILEKYIIDRIYKTISFENEEIVTIPLENNEELEEPYILKIIMRKICYKLHIDNIKQRSVEYLSQCIREKMIGKIKLTIFKNYNIHLTDNMLIVSKY